MGSTSQQRWDKACKRQFNIAVSKQGRLAETAQGSVQRDCKLGVGKVPGSAKAAAQATSRGHKGHHVSGHSPLVLSYGETCPICCPPSLHPEESLYNAFFWKAVVDSLLTCTSWKLQQ